MSVVAVGAVCMAFTVLFTARAYRNNTPTGVGQSRREAIVEAWVNILIGFSINFVANLMILPLVGFHIGAWDNWWIGWIYTSISIIRQYAIRRWFNDKLHRLAQRLAH